MQFKVEKFFSIGTENSISDFIHLRFLHNAPTNCSTPWMVFHKFLPGAEVGESQEGYRPPKKKFGFHKNFPKFKYVFG